MNTIEIKDSKIEFTTNNADVATIEIQETECSIRYEAHNEAKGISIRGFYSVQNDDPFLNIQIERGHACHHFCGRVKVDGKPVELIDFLHGFIIPAIKEALDIESVKEETLAEIYNMLSVRYCSFMHKHGQQGYEMYSGHKIEDPLGWGWNID